MLLLITHYNVNNAVTDFYNLLYSVIDRTVAKFRTSKHTYRLWFNSNVKRLIKFKKYYYFRKWKKLKAVYYYTEFRRVKKIN